jgi:hypothetical protein
MRHALGLGTCVVAIAVGCGGDDNRPSIGTSEGNVCDQIAAVACYDMYQCCSEGEIERDLGVSDPRTEDQCKQDVVRICERRLATAEASYTAKRVQFDNNVMNGCLKSLLAPSNACATVDSMLPWAETCMETAWVGQVATGGQCFFTFECANPGTQFCAPDQTCTALPTEGMPCSPQGCATGFFCNGPTCHAQQGPGGACTSTQSCQKDLFCDFSATPPACTAIHDGGQPCTSSAACKSGQCNPGTCAGNGASCFTSANCSKHCSNNNGFCNVDGDCGIGHCSVTTTQFCSVQGTCPGTETCVLPNMCLPGTCTGNVVCAAVEVTVDYCTGAINNLPLTP